MQATSFDPSAIGITGGESLTPQRELGRDEFLRLLVAKLQNQDPLEPSKDTQFVSELATFSSLEQLIEVNQNLQGLGLSQAQLINSQALGLIGKEALIDAGGTLRIKDGQPDTLVYAVPREAQDVTLTIRNASGQVVRTFALGPSPDGRVTLDWDGTDENGLVLADGDYTLDVQATDTQGQPMTVALWRSLPIQAVAFLNGGIALISGDLEIPFEMIYEIRAGS